MDDAESSSNHIRLKLIHNSLLQDDGSGKQRFSFTRTQGGYTIAVGGVGTCGNLITAQACGGANSLTFQAAVSFFPFSSFSHLSSMPQSLYRCQKPLQEKGILETELCYRF